MQHDPSGIEPDLADDLAEAGCEPRRQDAVSVATRVLLEPFARVAKRLRGDEALCVVVVPPQADWCSPVGRAIAEIVAGSQVTPFDRMSGILARHEPAARASAREEERRQVIERLSKGRFFIGVSHLPETCLPDTLVRAADHVVRLAPLSGRKLRRIVREVTGEDPGRVSDDLAGAITVDDIGACVRPGGGAKAAVARLEAARSARSRTREAGAPPLEDLAGYGEAKSWGLMLVREVARYRAGQIGLADLPRGLLLSGAPGTGKTLYAQALARSCGLPIVATSAARWLSAGDGHLDDAIKAVRADFAAATAMPPCIVFIDEADALVDPSIGSDSYRSWWMSLRAGLLSTIDGASSVPGIILIGACNHPDMVDAALKRAGRLDREIQIELPDRDALVQILRVHLGADLADADLGPLADLAIGSSGADMERAVRDARAAARDAGRPLGLEDVRAALVPTDIADEGEMRLVALHEAGHAVIATLLAHGVESVSIVRRGDSYGRAFVDLPRRLTRTAILEVVLVALAGRAADVLLGRGPCAGSSTDLAAATNLLARLHAAYGLGESLLSVPEDQVDRLLAVDPALRALVAQQLEVLWRHALALVGDHAAIVEAVAAALVQDKVVGATRLRALVEQHRRDDGLTDPACA